MQTEGTRTLQTQIKVKAPREVVWRAITAPDQLTRWLAPEARVKPGLGGHVWLSWPGMAGEERIDAWDEGRHLRLRGKGPIATDWYIEGQSDEESTIRLAWPGFGWGKQWDTEYEYMSRGWSLGREVVELSVAIRNLKHMLERHPQAPARHLIISMLLRGLEPLSAWTWLLGPRGLGLERVGERGFRARTGSGETLTGELDVCSPPRVLSLTVSQWNDARLTANLSGGDGDPTLWFSLLTFGLDDAAMAALRERWSVTLNRLFA
jgi:hypothetical protein